MALITIPENFAALPDGLAPICVEDHDSEGRPINLQWIDRGVRPIHRDLCNLVTVLIGDVWAVSEIVNRSVHGLSANMATILGRSLKPAYIPGRSGRPKMRQPEVAGLDDASTNLLTSWTPNFRMLI